MSKNFVQILSLAAAILFSFLNAYESFKQSRYNILTKLFKEKVSLQEVHSFFREKRTITRPRHIRRQAKIETRLVSVSLLHEM